MAILDELDDFMNTLTPDDVQMQGAGTPLPKKYTKQEILKSRKYEKWREWLRVNLPDEGTYTLADVEDFMTPLFEETNANLEIDLTFDPDSTKPQTGTAVAQAIASVNPFEENGMLKVHVATAASEEEIIKLSKDGGSVEASIRLNDQGALFHSGHLGVWSLDAGGSLTKNNEPIATESYVNEAVANAGGSEPKIVTKNNLSDAKCGDLLCIDLGSNDTSLTLPKSTTVVSGYAGEYYSFIIDNQSGANLTLPTFKLGTLSNVSNRVYGNTKTIVNGNCIIGLIRVFYPDMVTSYSPTIDVYIYAALNTSTSL